MKKKNSEEPDQTVTIQAYAHEKNSVEPDQPAAIQAHAH